MFVLLAKCPSCGKAEAQRMGRLVEPRFILWDKHLGDIYACFCCFSTFVKYRNGEVKRRGPLLAAAQPKPEPTKDGLPSEEELEELMRRSRTPDPDIDLS